MRTLSIEDISECRIEVNVSPNSAIRAGETPLATKGERVLVDLRDNEGVFTASIQERDAKRIVVVDSEEEKRRIEIAIQS